MSRWASTLWLFRAGVVAALLQFVTLLLIVPGFTLLSHAGLMEPILIDHAGQVSTSPLLPWSCLLLAMNSAMTNHRIRAETAARIRRTSRMMKPTAPDEWVHALIAQAWLGVIAMVLLALVAPPNFVLAAASLVGYPVIAAIGWPVLASIGAAWFGGIAFAARQAL